MEIVFVAAKRTPFGTFGGTLSPLSATDLADHASKAALAQCSLTPHDIDHVIFGNVLQTSSDAAYLARHVALRSGLPETVPAVTINRLCGSGFEAICDGVRRLRLGEARAVLVGGTESMSQAPFVLRGVRFGKRLNHEPLEDSLMAGLYDSFAKTSMAETAELLAEQHGISRADCDEIAMSSHEKAREAWRRGAFREEVAPIEDGKGRLDRDEHIRADCTIVGLSKLRPVFKNNGVVTAGNASGMVDGACALVLTTREYALERKVPVLGTFIDSFVIGCDPRTMGIGPVPACRALMARAGLGWGEIHRLEINEAFAAQYAAVERELKFPRAIANTQGGAIAIGHPLGASGARIVARLLYSLKERGGGMGLGSACIGGGQGMTVMIRV